MDVCPHALQVPDSESLRRAVAHSKDCTSDFSCIKSGTCKDKPVCAPVLEIGMNAGFVHPTESAEKCGYCAPSFGGNVCFCPARWALERAKTRASGLADALPA